MFLQVGLLPVHTVRPQLGTYAQKFLLSYYPRGYPMVSVGDLNWTVSGFQGTRSSPIQPLLLPSLAPHPFSISPVILGPHDPLQFPRLVMLCWLHAFLQ